MLGHVRSSDLCARLVNGRGTVVIGALAVALVFACGPHGAGAQDVPATSRPSASANAETLRARNITILDSTVFVIGVGILGGVLVWWGRRIFTED